MCVGQTYRHATIPEAIAAMTRAISSPRLDDGVAEMVWAHDGYGCTCVQAGAKKVYAAEASDMADFARALADANPGRFAPR